MSKLYKGRGYYRLLAENASNAELRRIREEREAKEALQNDWRNLRGGYDVAIYDAPDGNGYVAYLPDVSAGSGCYRLRRVTDADLADINTVAASTRCGLRDMRECAEAVQA
jgi:hypothetical protein